MEIYENVELMKPSEILNHPLMDFEEDLYEYWESNPEIDQHYILFFALATKGILNAEKEGDNIFYLLKNIEVRFTELVKYLGEDSDQFKDSLPFIDSIILMKVLEILFHNDYSLEIINSILDIEPEDSRYDILIPTLENFVDSLIDTDYRTDSILDILSNHPNCNYVQNTIDNLLD